jgi:hypothetical protein
MRVGRRSVMSPAPSLRRSPSTVQRQQVPLLAERVGEELRVPMKPGCEERHGQLPMDDPANILRPSCVVIADALPT